VIALINWLYRTGIRRGTTGRSWAWLVVALAAAILRHDRQQREEAAVSMQIKPGERMVIQMRDLDPSSDA
jgi:hypothetical protein